MNDSEDEAYHMPACIRCHTHKVRCTRPANKTRCKRCYRANVECVPRPSRRTRDAHGSPLSTEVSTPSLDEDPAPIAVTQSPADASSSNYTPDNTDLALHQALDLSMNLLGHVSDRGQESVDSFPADFFSCFGLGDPAAFHPLPPKTASSWLLHDIPGPGLAGRQEEFSSEANVFDALSGGSTPYPFLSTGQLPLSTSQASSEDARDWTTRAALLNAVLDQHCNRISALVGALRTALSSSHDLYRPLGITTLPIDRWFTLGLELSSLVGELPQAPLAAGYPAVQGSVQPSAPFASAIPSEPQQSVGGDIRRPRRLSDRANNLLLVSSFTRLSSAFSQALECLQLVLEHDRNMQSTTAMSLYPSLQLGDCVLGPMSTALQAVMVMEGATVLLERLSASIHMHLRQSCGRENDTASAGKEHGIDCPSFQPGMDDVVASMLQLLQAEQNSIRDRVRNLRGLLSDARLPTALL